MPISPQQLNGARAWRYATKVFNPSRRLDDTTWATLEDPLCRARQAMACSPGNFWK